jgi:nucleoside-diphosphate-sugar epimerase
VGDRGDRFINQVHRDDIVLGLLLLAQRRVDCRGQIFNVVGDKPITASEAYGWLQARLGSIAPATSAPTRARKRGESNKQVSNRKLRALGWQPRYPNFEIAMSESILPSFGF